MEKKIKKMIVNAITIALKTATLIVPFPNAQVSLQSMIDMLREDILSIPTGFPMIKDTLSNANELVIATVSDMINDLDIRNEPFDTTSKMAEEWLKKHGPFSDRESEQIMIAFLAYIDKVEIWAVQNPQILLKCIKALLSELGNQAVAIERQSDSLAEIRKWLQEVDKNLCSRLPEVEPSLYNYDKSNEKNFYRYFLPTHQLQSTNFSSLTTIGLRT